MERMTSSEAITVWPISSFGKSVELTLRKDIMYGLSFQEESTGGFIPESNATYTRTGRVRLNFTVLFVYSALVLSTNNPLNSEGIYLIL